MVDDGFNGVNSEIGDVFDLLRGEEGGEDKIMGVCAFLSLHF
jgi:hypothetical protein